MSWETAVCQWLLRGVVVTLPLLTVAAAAVACCRQPVRRVRLIELALVGCLVGPWLAWLPGVPRWSAAAGSKKSGVSSEERLKGDRKSEVGNRKLPEASAHSRSRLPAPSLRPPTSDLVLEPAIAPAESVEPAAPPGLVGSEAVVPRHRVLRLICFGYLAGVGAMAAWWALGLIGLARVLRSAVPADEGGCELLREIAGDAARRVRLLISTRIEQPFTFAWSRPVIVLPRSLGNRAGVALGVGP